MNHRGAMEFSSMGNDSPEIVLNQALMLIERAPQQAWQLVEQVLQVVTADQSRYTHARAYYVAGICHTTQGRLARARPVLTAAQESFEQQGLVVEAACCKREHAIAAYYAGSYELARSLLTEAWHTLDAHAQPVEASRCLIWLATLENFLQHRAAAQQYLAAARTCLIQLHASTEQAACDFVAGLIASRRTDYEEALRYFATAEAAFSSLGVAVWLGRVYIEQAYTLFALERFTVATGAACKACALFQEHGMPQREAFANDLLGQIATATNQFAEAQQLYEHAQVAYEAAGMPVHSIQALIHRANIDYYLNAWGLAEQCYREALERAQRYGARIPIFVARLNLGLIAWKLGRFDEGLRLAQFALKDALLLERFDDAAKCHLQLAGIYVSTKQHAKAATHYQEAIDLLTRHDKPLSYADAQLEFAEFCWLTGTYDQARTFAQAARNTYVVATTPILVAHCDLLLAKICLSQQLLVEASTLVEQCIVSCTAYELPISYARAQLVRGAVAAATGDVALAQQLYQQSVDVLANLLPSEAADGAIALAGLAAQRQDDALALEWEYKAVRWIQLARSRVPMESFAAALTDRYTAMLVTTLSRAIIHGDYTGALRLAEDARAQVALSWAEGRRRNEPLDQETLAIAERCAELRTQIEALQDETDTSAATSAAERQATLAALQQRYDEALALWRRFGSHVIPGTPQPFDCQRWLDYFKSQPYPWQVLAYWLIDDQLVIWHATADTINCIQRQLEPYDRWALDQCTRPEYNRRLYVYDPPTDASLTDHPGLKALHQVATLVLPDGLANSLTPETLLIIVPAGLLHRLPFAALPLNRTPLVTHATPLITPSLHLLERLNAHTKTSATSTLAVGVTQHREREHLLYACAEATMIESIIGNTVVRCDERATIAQFQADNASGLLRAYRQIHFATHAWPDLTSGMQAGVALFDGDLQLTDLAHLDLDADLLVLSACDSGIGKSYAGEEVVSLTFVLLQAGARAVVTSLWPVIDTATLDVMRGFYAARRDGMLGPWGLVAAQRHAWEQGLAPFIWAGFTWNGASDS